jgi:hypothetical protein
MVCDQCGKKLDLLKGWISCSNKDAAEWAFVCKSCPEGFYDIAASRFFRSTESMIDWLAHLKEKNWFDPRKFFEFMHRLRANGSFYGRA